MKKSQGSESLTGSSPRVRGKLHPNDPTWRRSGLIPACAGKTFRSCFRLSELRAHPRVCVENDCLSKIRGDVSGSSPRVRGKPKGAIASDAAAGLIPACAGKTSSRSRRFRRRRAHPRVCGENIKETEDAGGGLGSSPRVRGKRLTSERRPQGRGLIPACAGKTTVEAGNPRITRAHPRVCGENFSSVSRYARSRGSSPRVRGKLLTPLIGALTTGLIPACAGKTKFVHCADKIAWAHPRVCGENKIRESARFKVAGSSPRVRGKPNDCTA